MGFSMAMLVYWRVNWCLIWSERLRLATGLSLYLEHGRWTKSELPDGKSQQEGLHSFSKFFFSKKDLALQLAARWFGCFADSQLPRSSSLNGGFSIPISCCLWLLWSFPCVSAFACFLQSARFTAVKQKESPCACQLWAKSQSRQS